MERDELLTTRELAERLATTPENVRALVRAGRIPEIKLGHRTRRYRWGEVVDALCAARRNEKEGVDA